MEEKLNLWLFLDLFVRIITLTVIAKILAKTMHGIILTIFIGLFILWAFRPFCLTLIKKFELQKFFKRIKK